MRLDHNFFHAQKDGASLLVVVHLVFDGAERVFQQQTADFPLQRGHDFLFHDRHQTGDSPFQALQRDVPRKTVGHDDVSFSREDIARLHIADKVDSRIFQQRKDLAVESVPLRILRPVGQERDLGRNDALRFGIGRPHERKLQQIDRLAVGVRARI